MRPGLIDGAPSFLEFCASLSPPLVLEAGQVVACKVGFDGVQPRDLVGEERALARELFGDVETIPPELCDILVFVFGARGGKTRLGAARLLHLALFVDLSSLAPGQEGKCWIIAPELDLSSEGMNYIRGAIEADPDLCPLLVNPPREGVKIERLTIKRDFDGRIVAFEAKAAKKMGTTERGRTLIAVLMDEAGFFLDESYKVNDVEVFNAVQPRMFLPAGQLMVFSTPWGESGLLYDLYKANHPGPGGRPSSALAALAATPTMRTNPGILAQVHKAQEIDRQRGTHNAEREFFCKFLSLSAVVFFAPEDLNAAIAKPGELPAQPPTGALVGAGGDVGLLKNSSAVSVALRVKNTLLVPVLEEKHPDQGVALKPSEVFAMFAATLRAWKARALALDSAYRESAREDLDRSGLVVTSAAPTVELFTELRTAFRERRIKMIDDPLVRDQLRSIRIRPRPGGGESLVVPTTPDGRHCDKAVALATAVFEAWFRGTEVTAEPAPFDVDEMEREMMEEQDQDRRDEQRLGWMLRARGFGAA